MPTLVFKGFQLRLKNQLNIITMQIKQGKEKNGFHLSTTLTSLSPNEKSQWHHVLLRIKNTFMNLGYLRKIKSHSHEYQQCHINTYLEQVNLVARDSINTLPLTIIMQLGFYLNCWTLNSAQVRPNSNYSLIKTFFNKNWANSNLNHQNQCIVKIEKVEVFETKPQCSYFISETPNQFCDNHKKMETKNQNQKSMNVVPGQKHLLSYFAQNTELLADSLYEFSIQIVMPVLELEDPVVSAIFYCFLLQLQFRYLRSHVGHQIIKKFRVLNAFLIYCRRFTHSPIIVVLIVRVFENSRLKGCRRSLFSPLLWILFQFYFCFLQIFFRSFGQASQKLQIFIPFFVLFIMIQRFSQILYYQTLVHPFCVFLSRYPFIFFSIYYFRNFLIEEIQSLRNLQRFVSFLFAYFRFKRVFNDGSILFGLFQFSLTLILQVFSLQSFLFCPLMAFTLPQFRHELFVLFFQYFPIKLPFLFDFFNHTPPIVLVIVHKITQFFLVDWLIFLFVFLELLFYCLFVLFLSLFELLFEFFKSELFVFILVFVILFILFLFFQSLL